MKRAALAAAFVLLAVPVAAEERLVVKPPEGWEQVLRDYGPELRTVGFAPRGQTGADWTEMITFQVALGRADISPKEASAEVRGRWKAVCRDLTGEAPKLAWDKEYLSVLFFMQCRNPKQSPGSERLKKTEVLAVKAIQGRESFFLIQRAWRSDTDGPGNPFAAPATRKAWMAFFATAEVCDASLPQQPCGARPAPDRKPSGKR